MSRSALAIILIEVVFGILYAVNTPRWEAPDEPAHFNYVRHVALTATLPVLSSGDYDQAYLENLKSNRFPAGASIDSIRYESYEPPLYYVAAAPIFLLAGGTGVDPVIALRLLSVALGALVLLIGYRVLVRVFPTQGYMALAGLAFMATVPMHIFMTAVINADALAEVMLAAILLLALRRVAGELSDRQFIVMGGVLYGLALLTSIKTYPVAAILIPAELLFRGWRAVAHLKPLAALFGVALLLSIWWFARNAVVYGASDVMGLARHDAVVVGQPTTTEWIARSGLSHVVADFLSTTFRSFWAQFGWMGVLVDERIYLALFALTGAAIVGALLFVIRLVRESARRDVPLRNTWMILAAWILIYLLAHVWYNLRFEQPQGRYLFPALIPIAAFWAAGLNELFEKQYVRGLFVLIYLGMLLLDYVSLFWFIIPQLKG